MDCKYCGAVLEEEQVVCPVCGKAQTEEEAAVEEAAVEEAVAEEAVAEEIVSEEVEELPAEEAVVEGAPAKKKRGAGIIIGVLAVVVVALAAVLISMLTKPAQSENVQTEQVVEGAEGLDDGSFVVAVPEGTPSYTVTEEEMTEEMLDAVVAECGDFAMTNRELGIYYWQQYYTVASGYGQYLSFMLDTTVPFDQQMYMDGVQTWQQFLIEGAMHNYHSVAAVYQEAVKNGYVLDEENEAYLAGMADELGMMAEAYGIGTADDYVKMGFGPFVTIDAYVDFARQTLTASGYLRELVEAQTYTDADIEAYFDANAENYAAQGLEKTDMTNVNIRHILIQPAEQDENGEYTEAAWQTAEEEIKAVMAQFEAGEKTEEAFGALAAEFSMDGNASQGGIYENVYPGRMVQEFNDWCFDAARKTGDYGLVKTQFGWHLIYFIEKTENLYWFDIAEEDYLTEISNGFEADIKAKYELTVNYENMAIIDLMAAEAEAATEEVTAE